jgi:DNA-directed RNA polymerase subunit alpha
MFNSPNQPRIRTLQQQERYGKFVIEPLDKGYGHTLGASLRRVLLTSIEGVAITAVQVQGVQHEFSTMPGVVEDMLEVVLNLKEVAVKSLNGRLEGPVSARIDKQGEGRITGADVQLPPELADRFAGKSDRDHVARRRAFRCRAHHRVGQGLCAFRFARAQQDNWYFAD